MSEPTTGRLVPAPVRPADHSALLAHWTRPEVRAFLFDGATLTAEQVTAMIETSVRGFAADRYGLCAARPGRPSKAGRCPASGGWPIVPGRSRVPASSPS